MRGWTCLLRSRDRTKPFLQPEQRWSSMWSMLPTRWAAAGVNQQYVNKKFRLLPTGAWPRKKICGRSFGQSSHPLQRVASSWPSVDASRNAAVNANATALVWPARNYTAADAKFRSVVVYSSRQQDNKWQISIGLLPTCISNNISDRWYLWYGHFLP